MTTYYMSDFMKGEVLLDSVSMADVGVKLNHSTFRKSKKRFKCTHFISDCVPSKAFPLDIDIIANDYKMNTVFIVKFVILHLSTVENKGTTISIKRHIFSP